MNRNIFVFLILLLPGSSFGSLSSDTAIIRSHLLAITRTEEYRNRRNTAQLDRTAEYIRSVFKQYSDSVFIQEYTVNGRIYKNVICSFGTGNKKRIIAGAHYDVCGNQEGADDNASGVAALLELARLLKDSKTDHRIDLVAYSLEEPPYFSSEHMGSYIHAKSLADNGADVYGMIAIEMIGYFRDEKKTQKFPAAVLSLIYGHKGNFITLVKKFGSGKFARRFCMQYKKARTIRTKKFTGPVAIPGVDFSDHMNYWNFGYSALMITDTAFYRNPNYHQKSDTIETLDLQRMSQVINGLFLVLSKM